MHHLAQPGSRIVDPFSRKFVAGYIVALREGLRPGTSLQESDIKNAKELLDVVPLVTPELLELTRWVSEYYLAPWGEVIKAALPPGISPMIEQFFSITAKGRAELNELASVNAPTIRQRLLQLLSEPGELGLAAVSNQFGNSQATKLARELERDGVVEILQRPGSEFVRAKYQRRVRMVHVIDGPLASPPVSPPVNEGRRLTAAQQRVIEALKGRKSLAHSELLAAAEVSAFPTFAEAPRRIYMSATISDDSEIIRTFDVDPVSIPHALTSRSLAGVS